MWEGAQGAPPLRKDQMTDKIRSLHRQESPPQVALALGGRTIAGKSGWEAVAEVQEDGHAFTLYLSRLDGESRWVIDGKWAGARPVFHNGWGSRCTRLTFPSPELEAKLRARTIALEVEG
jgi:hypothetical protein